MTQTESLANTLAETFRRDYPDVEVDIRGSRFHDVIILWSIRVPANRQRQGIGTRVMSALCEAADTNGVTLACTPSTDFGASMAGLVRFYRRFGFRPNKGRTVDLTISESMIRRPVAQ